MGQCVSALEATGPPHSAASKSTMCLAFRQLSIVGVFGLTAGEWHKRAVSRLLANERTSALT